MFRATNTLTAARSFLTSHYEDIFKAKKSLLIIATVFLNPIAVYADGLTLNADGITFPDGTRQTTAYSGLEDGQQQDYALRFFQNDQGVQVPNSESLNITGPITVEAWVYAENLTLNSFFNFIISKQLDGTGYALLASGDSSNKVVRFESSGGPENAVVSNVNLPLNEWVHIAATCSNNGYSFLYFNGTLISEGFCDQGLISNDQDLFIGHSIFGQELNWKGLIDDVRIWNTERTQEEIYQYMRFAPETNSVGLVAYWDFNDGPGSDVLTDKSQYENNGSLINQGSISPDLPQWVLSNNKN